MILMSAGKILRKHVLQIKQRLSHSEEKVNILICYALVRIVPVGKFDE